MEQEKTSLRETDDFSSMSSLTGNSDGVDRLGAFGVPTISVNGQRGFFGPVITSVPTGEDAGELWDHLAWLAARSDFFEYKRSRK